MGPAPILLLAPLSVTYNVSPQDANLPLLGGSLDADADGAEHEARRINDVKPVSRVPETTLKG